MRLFDLVEEHYAIRLSAYRFGELSTLFVSYISWRRTYKATYRMFFHIFTHIDTYERFFGIEQKSGQCLGGLCLTYTSRSKEHKASDGSVGIGKPRFVSLDGTCHRFDRLILPHYVFA